MKSMGEYKEFNYKGIKRITIPYTDSDFIDNGKAISIINKYLPNIMSLHIKNAEKEKFFYDFMKGRQDVYDKERLYNKDAKNNNKIVENHAFRQVSFKTGFIIGEKRDYIRKTAPKDDGNTDDLTYLDRYFTDVDFFSKDKDLKEWIYTTGIGVTYCEPRTDIIIPSGNVDLNGNPVFRYKTEAEGFNVNKDASFAFDVVEPMSNFVVYSSSRSGEPLFCVSVVTKDIGDADTIDVVAQLQIETRYGVFETNSDLDYTTFDKARFKSPKIINYIPMVEHSINNFRLGLVELNREMFNSINTLISSVSDIIVDNANVILVFKNVDIDGEAVQEMKQAGAIIISDNSDSKSSADLDTIKVQMDFEGFNAYYEQRISKCYDIAGVPLASGQVTSGGDTGQARLLGGGWNNAYTVAKNDITSLLKSDYAVLKLILQFCKQVPNCPVDNLSASEIDIKYRINQNDNFLVKAEGISQLYNCNLPLEEILKASGLFSDTDAVATKWAERIKQVQQEAQALENQSTQTGNDSQE